MFAQLFHTTWGSMCAMTLTSIGWDLRNKAKTTKETSIVNCYNFSKTVLTIRTKISTAILHYMGDLCEKLHYYRKAGIRETAKIDQRTANCQLFQFFFKDSQHHSNEIFHSHFEAY